MYMQAYDSRQSYLSGLLSRGRLGRFGYDPRARYLSAYNSRQSYLNGLLSRGRRGRGLGQDGSDEAFDINSLPDLTNLPVDINTLPDLTNPDLYLQSGVPSGPILNAGDVVTPANPSGGIPANQAVNIAQAASQTALAAAKLGTNYGAALQPVSAQSPYAAPATSFLTQSSIIAGMSNGAVLGIFGAGVLLLSVVKKK